MREEVSNIALESGIAPPLNAEARDVAFGNEPVLAELKMKSVRGSTATVAGQAVNLFIRTGSMMILARLLTPFDFGLVAMVNGVTGFVGLFKDAGLSMATVQREKITPAQISTLFWINVALSLALMLLLWALAPFIALFYHEPRLTMITVALGGAFLLGGLTVQHQALLRRQMKFTTLSIIDILSLCSGIATSIVMALMGFGYWAVVGNAVAAAFVNAVCVWVALGWIPGAPKRGCGTHSMLHFGGNVAGVNVASYFARNADNILVGWCWGAGVLGFYDKAYQLLMLPINQINSPISAVLMPALSRLQSAPKDLRDYFLGSYSLIVGITIPIILAICMFAHEVVYIVLGPKWQESAVIFQLLGPAALVGAILNPFGSLLVATGFSRRAFRISLVVCPLIVLSFVLGLSYGARGVAISYSMMMALLVVPLILSMIHGTVIGFGDVVRAVRYPALAGVCAFLAGTAYKWCVPLSASPALIGVSGCAIVVSVYAFILLVIFNQWHGLRQFLLSGLSRRVPK